MSLALAYPINSELSATECIFRYAATELFFKAITMLERYYGAMTGRYWFSYKHPYGDTRLLYIREVVGRPNHAPLMQLSSLIDDIADNLTTEVMDRAHKGQSDSA